MYGWDEDPSSWYGEGKYKYGDKGADKRKKAASRARASGPRTYQRKGRPNTQLTDPRKTIRTDSKTPMIIAVDVTGSMADWPAQIFDRLPLLYNTLSAYRDDLALSFIAFGDEHCDEWPMQVTDFAAGFDLEDRLKGLHGEGGGGDMPESYGLLAWYIHNRVFTPQARKPFLIVFGDAAMHPVVSRKALQKLLGIPTQEDADALKSWAQVCENWNTWFLRRPTGRPGDAIEKQWKQAVGDDRVIRIGEEERAVDYAMGLVARAWGHLDDFRVNLLARQDQDTVEQVSRWVERHGPRVLECPKCHAPIPLAAVGRFKCEFCSATLEV